MGESKPFPKYTTQILNLCNQNAQGTRPQVVGQMTELIQECPYKSYTEWEKWYRTRKPSAIVDATVKIKRMVDNLKGAIELIDDQMIRSWVEDLVLVKTFVGLRFQAAILSKIAKMKRTTFRLATPTEESKGIDGSYRRNAGFDKAADLQIQGKFARIYSSPDYLLLKGR